MPSPGGIRAPNLLITRHVLYCCATTNALRTEAWLFLFCFPSGSNLRPQSSASCLWQWALAHEWPALALTSCLIMLAPFILDCVIIFRCFPGRNAARISKGPNHLVQVRAHRARRLPHRGQVERRARPGIALHGHDLRHPRRTFQIFAGEQFLLLLDALLCLKAGL